jgi:phosphoribosyl-AMP cyclohydrolase
MMQKLSKNQIDEIIKLLDFSKLEDSLIPVIIQDFKSNKVLMLAFANREAVRKSLETGLAHFYSRSRKKLWKKGETSGHFQEIEQIIIDCDKDSLLLKVKQIGGTCHEGYDTCFYNQYINGSIKVIGKKVFNPEKVYKKDL